MQMEIIELSPSHQDFKTMRKGGRNEFHAAAGIKLSTSPRDFPGKWTKRFRQRSIH